MLTAEHHKESMMKVKFLTNLGSRDADEFNLDYTQCSCGAETNISKAAAESFEKRGIVEVLEQPAIQAIPKNPALAKAKPVASKPQKTADTPAEKTNLSADSQGT